MICRMVGITIMVLINQKKLEIEVYDYVVVSLPQVVNILYILNFEVYSCSKT